MNNKNFRIESLNDQNIEPIVEFWRETMSDAIGIPPIHPAESQSYFLKNILPVDYKIDVVIDIQSQKPVAFMASNACEVNQLYVAIHFKGKGIGSHLIDLAKHNSSGSLKLRTFDVNKKAKAFYEKHGFISHAGNCDNEESLLDVEYIWAR